MFRAFQVKGTTIPFAALARRQNIAPLKLSVNNNP